MAKFVAFQTFDLISNTISGNRLINPEHVVELTGYHEDGHTPLTRIKLVTGDFFDVPLTIVKVSEILK